MKIIHIITSLGDGGAENILRKICKYDLNNEHIKDMNLTLDKFFNSSDYMLSDLHNGNN